MNTSRLALLRKFLPASKKENIDRFIPYRSAMNFDHAHFALMEGGREAIEGEEDEVSLSKRAYRKKLAEAMNLDRTRILAFRNKPSTSVQLLPKDHSASSLQHHHQPPPLRRIPPPARPDRTLDAPGLLDDFYLNVLDWSSADVLAVALDCSVCLWDASTGSVSVLVSYDDDKGPVSSLNWADDGLHLGVGLNNGEVHILNCETKTIERILEGCHHHTRVGSLAWNSHILTTGGMDGGIFNNDVRIRSCVVSSYKGHTQEVCGLKWSGESGQQLASGGNDSLVHIWDRRSTSSSKWLHRLRGHTSAVKALSWCPFQSNLLASGGGGEDGKIKFWNTQTGACLNSVDTGFQLTSLLWSNKERELLSSHGSELTLWKYPSMVKMAELYGGHTSRVLSMTQSPDGCTVVSAAGDERLCFWSTWHRQKTCSKSTS